MKRGDEMNSFSENVVPAVKGWRDEVAVIGGAILALLTALLPLVSAADFTTGTGVMVFVTAAGSLVVRSKVWSAGSVADVSAEPAGEVPV
tara:strand:- start:380 stop:649 length:270 start_codon:yes stop_codon:yes gene_type:complete